MNEDFTEKAVQIMVEDLLKAYTDLFLVNVSLRGYAGNQTLLVEIDGDSGVSIQQCANVSKNLGAMLEDRDLITRRFNLEVTSPGVGKPLKSIRHYKKNIGREIKIETSQGDTLRGILKGFQNDTLKLSGKHREDIREIPLSQIKRSNVILSFK